MGIPPGYLRRARLRYGLCDRCLHELRRTAAPGSASIRARRGSSEYLHLWVRSVQLSEELEGGADTGGAQRGAAARGTRGRAKRRAGCCGRRQRWLGSWRSKLERRRRRRERQLGLLRRLGRRGCGAGRKRRRHGGRPRAPADAARRLQGRTASDGGGPGGGGGGPCRSFRRSTSTTAYSPSSCCFTCSGGRDQDSAASTA